MMAERPVRPAASAVIWPWREGASQAAVSPSRVRRRALLQALAGAAFGSVCFLFWSRSVAYFAFAMAALVLVSALVSPSGLHAGMQRLFETTGRVLGRAMTWLLMAPLFYLFFLPFGMILRRGKRDRLRRYFDPEAESYWESHTSVPTSSWERQY
jgi:hypothetical protein